MPATSVQLLVSTASTMEVTGTPVSAGGSFGSRSGLHTVAWTMSAFKGRIKIQGTLNDDSASASWFDLIWPDASTYKQYSVATTSTETVNFTGNITFMRAVVTRAYDNTLNSSNAGTVTSMRLNF